MTIFLQSWAPAGKIPPQLVYRGLATSLHSWAPLDHNSAQAPGRSYLSSAGLLWAVSRHKLGYDGLYHDTTELLWADFTKAGVLWAISQDSWTNMDPTQLGYCPHAGAVGYIPGQLGYCGSDTAGLLSPHRYPLWIIFLNN